MSYIIDFKNAQYIKLFVFTFALALVTYGFTLTNFTLTVDNELPILSDYGLDLGRWGHNIIRYHLFKGHLQYFSLILSLILFSVSAIRLCKNFKFTSLSAYAFCALFITFPQISYQVVFLMMADIAGLGVLLSVICVELFQKGLEIKSYSKKIIAFLSAILIMIFTLSLYQAFIFVPTAIYSILFFQKTFADSFKLSLEIKRIFFFGSFLIISLVLYYLSVKIICPIQDGGYIDSFVSGGTENQLWYFIKLWSSNLVGTAYYGSTLFIVTTACSIGLLLSFILIKKHLVIRSLLLIIIMAIPFLMSSIITNGYHPPRLYLTSNLVFAFIIVFAINYFKVTFYSLTTLILALLTVVNIYFVTKLFSSANKIYKHDKRIAEKIDDIILAKYPDFLKNDRTVYFYGYFPYDYHQRFRVENSEIFGGSFFVWDNGSNYRIINFFKEADVAEYKMIETKEKFDVVKDSIDKMPLWPDYESVKMFNGIVVVKLGQEKGAKLFFE